jgi:hypothetical protein
MHDEKGIKMMFNGFLLSVDQMDWFMGEFLSTTDMEEFIDSRIKTKSPKALLSIDTYAGVQWHRICDIVLYDDII